MSPVPGNCLVVNPMVSFGLAGARHHEDASLMLYKQQALDHPLFSIPELVAEIVHRGQSDKKDLFALALVSKAFSKPVLDALWRQLGNFDVLINLLPRTVYNRSKTI